MEIRRLAVDDAAAPACCACDPDRETEAMVERLIR
jgi:hypothetical protein